MPRFSGTSARLRWSNRRLRMARASWRKMVRWLYKPESTPVVQLRTNLSCAMRTPKAPSIGARPMWPWILRNSPRSKKISSRRLQPKTNFMSPIYSVVHSPNIASMSASSTNSRGTICSSVRYWCVRKPRNSPIWFRNIQLSTCPASAPIRRAMAAAVRPLSRSTLQKS